MAKLRTIIATSRAVADAELSFESSSVILGPVTLFAAFWHDSQIFEQFTTSAAVLLDPSIDGRNADRELACLGQPVADLLRAPLQLQKFLYFRPLFLTEVGTSVAPVVPGDRV